ncbi:hypothetical protein WT49_04230 [Burkholderia territorii]|nr:hypothetical protein WT49_04230 [Burkholderia territorii]
MYRLLDLGIEVNRENDFNVAPLRDFEQRETDGLVAFAQIFPAMAGHENQALFRIEKRESGIQRFALNSILTYAGHSFQ